MKTRADIKEKAKAIIKQQGKAATYAALIFVIFSILSGLSSAIANFNRYYYYLPNGTIVSFVSPVFTFPLSLISLFLITPLGVGYAAFCIRANRNEPCSPGEVFSDTFGQYGRNLGGMLWMALFVFIWSLLLLIPGIIKALSYSMTQYIMGEYRHISGQSALKLSMRITEGRKMDIFVFGLSFIGWMILTGMTLGILGLYTTPYMNTSCAGLYLELKQDALARGVVNEADFM